jgi:hypothetical protein
MTTENPLRPRNKPRKYARIKTRIVGVFGANPYIQKIYEWFIRPLAMTVEHSNYSGEEEEIKLPERIRVVFGTGMREVFFCRANCAFRLPGGVWRNLSTPSDIVYGDVMTRRLVRKGDPLVYRRDSRTPERCEVEFSEQVFVMTEAEFNVVREKLEILA